jgi:hypothetical protein
MQKYTHQERPPHSSLKGALVNVLLAPPVVLGMCSSHPAKHRHHARVHEPADATKLHVDQATVAPAILVDVLSLFGPHWLDNRPLLKVSGWGGGRERSSGLANFELISYFIQNLM